MSAWLAFVAIAATILLAITWLHSRYIRNAAIYLSSKPPNFAQAAAPQVISFTLALFSGLAASIAYGLLKGEVVLPTWLTGLLGH